ncbi:MAG TPA: carboxypeptidase-like regulatory domain-containing protein [Gemmatimonadaceae bacterium]
MHRLRFLALIELAVSTIACHAARPTEAGPIPLPPVTLRARDTIPVGVLRGHVEADRPGDTLAETVVTLDDGRVETRTDSLGRFELAAVSAGPHRLTVRRVGFRPMYGAIEMPAGGGAAVRVVLETPLVCLDFCAPETPRPYGALRDVP